jgi:hypothetical protein
LRNRIENPFSVVRFRPGPPKSNNALLRAGHFLLGWQDWLTFGGRRLGGNLRFGRNEVSVDDLFLNELDGFRFFFYFTKKQINKSLPSITLRLIKSQGIAINP